MQIHNNDDLRDFSVEKTAWLDSGKTIVRFGSAFSTTATAVTKENYDNNSNN